MEIYETLKNENGTFTQRYKETVFDINGVPFEMKVDEKTVDPEAIRARINQKEAEKVQTIAMYDSEIAALQDQLNEIVKQG